MATTSTRTPGATTRALVVCLLAVAATLVGPVPAAQAWSEGACPDGEGITVVVDFRSLGGDTLVRCAPPPVESGYDALTRVGLDWTPTQRHPGFLCRIEGVPADDPCVNTPPTDAYWSYWRAEPGGSWAYSNYGPSSTSPPPGPVEGWSFSTGSRDQAPRTAPPGSAPPQPSPPSPSTTADPEPEPEPEPAPTSAPPPPPAKPDPTSPEPAPTSDDDPSTSLSTPTEAPSTPAPTGSASPSEPASASPSPSPSPTPSPTPTLSPTPTPSPTPSTTDRLTAATVPGDGGPPWGTLAGIVLVLGVAGGAAVAGRRRRRP